MDYGYEVDWTTATNVQYDTISEIVTDIIIGLADEENWQRVKFWANLMDTPGWKNKSEEEAIAYLKDECSEIEDIRIKNN